jgi:hypothetical protein
MAEMHMDIAWLASMIHNDADILTTLAQITLQDAAAALVGNAPIRTLVVVIMVQKQLRLVVPLAGDARLLRPQYFALLQGTFQMLRRFQDILNACRGIVKTRGMAC